MTLTRDGPNGVEVLLGRRSKTMRAFPNYWAFPGGGVSSVDQAAVEALSQLAGPEAASIACIMREMSEELGLAASGDGAIAVDPEARAAIVEDKKRWLPLALEGSFPVERERIRTLSHRITPPFGPVQFDNAFLHLHLGPWSAVPAIDLEPQTEFTEVMWAQPTEILARWKSHEIKVAPPVVTLLMEIERTLARTDRDMERAPQPTLPNDCPDVAPSSLLTVSRSCPSKPQRCPLPITPTPTLWATRMASLCSSTRPCACVKTWKRSPPLCSGIEVSS